MEKALEIDPENEAAHYQIGLVHGTKGLTEEAEEAFSKVIELNDNNISAYHNRGQIYYYNKEYNDAIYDYSKIVEIKPKIYFLG